MSEEKSPKEQIEEIMEYAEMCEGYADEQELRANQHLKEIRDDVRGFKVKVIKPIYKMLAELTQEVESDG